MLLISAREFEDHVTPFGHPERPERAHVFGAVAVRWAREGLRVAAPRPATRPELERAHAPSYVEHIEATRGGAVMLDPDTLTSPASATVARLAAGAAVQAAEHALGTHGPAFALVRPPGHHAEWNRAMGFCLYNNAAVAAAAARSAGAERVAVVDIDVHHGNGTQHAFYKDPHVLYISTHQFPFYPGTGEAEEVGEGAGAGYTLNVPIEAGATDADYLRIHEAVVLPVLAAFDPDLTIVSAGFDAHEDDPLASMRMTAAGYARLFQQLAAVAGRRAAFCAVTEGGYNLDALASCLDASLAALREVFSVHGAQAFPPPLQPGDMGAALTATRTVRAERAIAAVRAAHKPFWRQL